MPSMNFKYDIIDVALARGLWEDLSLIIRYQTVFTDSQALGELASKED